MGPAGTPAVARATERLRERWVKDRLIERGRVHANSMGFADIYSFTKAMAEHAVVELHGDIPLSIVRPSIIESALAEPFPGWLEGFRMAEPLILAFARATLQEFSGLPDGMLDIIPADLVVNATPLGMNHGDPLPVDVSRISPETFVGEVVLKEEMTAFLKAVQARGCRFQVGADMLFEQIPAYLEFFGFPTTTPETLRALARISY